MVDATVTLYKDVGLSPDYSRTIDFTSKTAQTNWFNTVQTDKITLTNVNYNKVQNSLYVHEQFGDVLSYSYARLQEIDDSGRTYYAFITNAELVDDETTRFDLIIDVIQTFMTEFEIAPSFVVREHIDRWQNIINNKIKYVTPSGEKINCYMNVESENKLNEDNYVVVVIAFTNDNYYKNVSEGMGSNLDKVYYGYSIINIADPTETVYGPRAVRDVHVSEAGWTANTYCDKVRYLYLDEILSGQFMDMFNIDPASIVSISIVPFASISQVVGSGYVTVQATFNPITVDYEVTTGQRITQHITADTESIEIRNVSGDVMWWGNPATAEYVYQGATTDTNVASYNTCPIYGSAVSDTEMPSLSQPILPLIVDGVNVDIYDMNFTIGYDWPEMPEDGDIASDTHEPFLYFAPYRKHYITDYKGEVLIDIPDNTLFESSSAYVNARILFDVSGIKVALDAVPTDDANEYWKNGVIGANAIYNTDGVPFVNDAWLNYKLTRLDTDRSNAMLNAVGNVITGGIYGAYGGALVGSRSASGDRDSDERRNTLLKRGAIGASIVGGISSVGAGLVTGIIGWENQKNKESAVQNQASQVSNGGIVTSYLNDNFALYHVTTRCDDLNYENAYSMFKYYGYSIGRFKTPDIRSRKYYNYIITQGCCIKGALNANIKRELASIFDSGITIFHGDYCSEPDYPVNSLGAELENIERTLIS